MNSVFLSPKTLKIANEIQEWAETYLMGEHEQMTRPYGTKEVCPYVAPSVKSNTFYMVFRTEVDGKDVVEIERIMLGYLTEFDISPPFHPTEQKKKTLLVVFPEIPEKQGFVLDRVHGLIKDKFVERGMMVGQFHKLCDERSVHNREFRVSTCPYPLIAIRYMQSHDILFLKDHDNPTWFDEYNRRYGETFRDPDNIPEDAKPFEKFYRDAKSKFTK